MMSNHESFGLRAAVATFLVATVYAFQTNPTFSRVGSALKVAVDPSTITNKEYEDICGVSFSEKNLQERLKSTKYLYPKHVEVIEDIGPLAGRMVDEIVSAPCDEDYHWILMCAIAPSCDFVFLTYFCLFCSLFSSSANM